jgi:hypothetical protein
MNAISFLDCFRTGRFGSVEIGMSKEQILSLLGAPDDWWRINSANDDQPYTQSESPIWIYGGVELYWEGANNTLSEISFKPHYLHWSKYITPLDCWIFRNQKGPTLRRLKAALKRESIPFQDTGLEIVVWQLEDRSKPLYSVVPLQNIQESYDSDDVFGTLVLKSGVQVRFGDDNRVITVSLSGRWGIKGAERFIKW